MTDRVHAPPGVVHPAAEPGRRKLFVCELQEVGARVALVRPIGELDIATVPELDARLTECVSGGVRELVIDLGGLTFLSVSGIRLLLAWTERAAADGFTLSLAPGPAMIQRVFALMGLEDDLPFRSARTDSGAGPHGRRAAAERR